MKTASLEELVAEHAALGEKIAQFEKREIAKAMFPITINSPDLDEGEIWVAAVITADGSKGHHVILLPGDNDDASQQDQLKWAASIGGDLPDRVESALLFANFKDEFKEEAYWTREEHAADSGYAWCQIFDYGGQDYRYKLTKLRALAVRRVPI